MTLKSKLGHNLQDNLALLLSVEGIQPLSQVAPKQDSHKKIETIHFMILINEYR